MSPDDTTPPNTPPPGTTPPGTPPPPPSEQPPPSGEQPLLTVRSALIFLTATVIATLLGTLTHLQTHDAAAAGIATIIGFGGTLALTNKTIH